jgi:hypothetical protein
VQCGPSNEVTSFRPMSQHTLQSLIYEAAKYSREMRTCLYGPISPLLTKGPESFGPVLFRDHPRASDNLSRMNFLLALDAMCSICLFSRSGVNQCGDGSKLTEASKKMDCGPYVFELLQIRACSFPADAKCQFDVHNPKQRSVAYRFSPTDGRLDQLDASSPRHIPGCGEQWVSKQVSGTSRTPHAPHPCGLQLPEAPRDHLSLH